jgi:hypothetical protein
VNSPATSVVELRVYLGLFRQHQSKAAVAAGLRDVGLPSTAAECRTSLGRRLGQDLGVAHVHAASFSGEHTHGQSGKTRLSKGDYAARRCRANAYAAQLTEQHYT